MTSNDENEMGSERNLNISGGEVECPVCLQTAVHPTKLPCGHIFCYLCLKGVVIISHRCALCRRETSKESIDNPQLIYGVNSVRNTKPLEDGYQWFYEGRNGWWQYDERTSIEIENAYKSHNKSCIIFVAGFIYIVDFDTMMQRRQNDPGKKRCVKRDLAIVPKKGVAGIRLDENLYSTPTDGNPNIVTVTNQIPIRTATPPTPPRTPLTPSPPPPPPPPPPTRSSPSTSNTFLQYFPTFALSSFIDLTRNRNNNQQQQQQQQPSSSGLNNYRNNVDLSTSPGTINLNSSSEHDDEDDEYGYDDEDDDNNDVILSRTIGDMQRLTLQSTTLNGNLNNDDSSDSDHV